MGVLAESETVAIGLRDTRLTLLVYVLGNGTIACANTTERSLRLSTLRSSISASACPSGSCDAVFALSSPPAELNNDSQQDPLKVTCYSVCKHHKQKKIVQYAAMYSYKAHPRWMAIHGGEQD